MSSYNKEKITKVSSTYMVGWSDETIDRPMLTLMGGGWPSQKLTRFLTTPSKSLGVHISAKKEKKLCVGVEMSPLIDGCDEIGVWFKIDGSVGGKYDPSKGEVVGTCF